MKASDFTKETIVEMFYKDERDLAFKEEQMFKKLLSLIYAKKYNEINADDFLKNYLILDFMAIHTSNMPLLQKIIHDNAIKRCELISKFKRTKYGFKFNDWQGKEIVVDKMTSHKHFKQKYPVLKKFIERTGHCHERSIEVALMTANEDCKVVTGYITSIAEDHRYLHSWVEYKSKRGKERCLDFNFNMILDKDDYYRIRHAEPKAYLSREQIIEYIDSGFIDSPEIKQLDFKPFLMFHEDLYAEYLENNPTKKPKPAEDSKPKTESQPEN